MNKAKHIFLVSDFKDMSAQSIRIQQRMWKKGLIRAGCDVQEFSYRNILDYVSPLSGTGLTGLNRLLQDPMRKRVDKILVRQLQYYRPDIIIFLGMKYMIPKTIERVRDAVPYAVLVGHDEDPFPEQKPDRLAIGRKMDWVITTSAGQFLNTYKKEGTPKCAFMPNLCDPDIQYRYPVGEEWKTDILFTGKPTHIRLKEVGDRFELIKRLSKMPQCKIYGAFGIPRVEGMDYFYALSGAKIVLSINITNNVALYHSDRLINAVACGAFVLAKRVPDTDLLFQDKKHVRYFDTADEFFDLADWYLRHDKDRNTIALAGMEYAHREYNCTKMANYFLQMIETGSIETPWKVIL